MIKTALKILLSVVLYALVFTIANIILPFSSGFRELGASADPMGILFILLNGAWICFTIYFIIKHSQIFGKKLFLDILFVIFFVQCFMTQIETLFFGSAFPALTKPDVILIMIANLIPLLATIPLLIKFFKRKDAASESCVIEKQPSNIKSIVLKLGIIGVIYLFVYLVFGYFVAWQFKELRIFYSGSSEKLSFFGQMLNNLAANPVIFPFQIFRGILFGAFIIPLRNMLGKNKMVFITSVCLVYLCTAVMLIIPNVLFPDIVRIGHLIEMTSSMLLFGIIVGNVMKLK